MRTLTYTRFDVAVPLLLGLALALAPTLSFGSQHPARTDAPGFSKYDSNKDNRVSLDEFKARKQLERAFVEADTNKDGWLNRDEFVKAVSISSRLQMAETVSDTWITTKVKSMLVKDDLLNGMKVDVNTQDRMVQLTGALESTEQISRAVKIASQVQGVKGVHNDLSLRK